MSPAEVFAWQFGFPFFVDLTRGFARYTPGDTRTSSSHPRRNRRHVNHRQRPVTFPDQCCQADRQHAVRLHRPAPDPDLSVSKLHVPVAFNGVETGGNCYRMDNVPMDCRKVVEPPEGMLTDEEFLIKVRDRLKQLKEAA